MNLPNLFQDDLNVQVLLCQPDKSIMGEIIVHDLNGAFKFNTYSEISFTIDRFYNDLIDGKTKVNPYYDFVDSLRVIYLRGIGHFIIQDVDDEINENESKSITCFSLEYSTGQKYLENFYINTGEDSSVEVMYHTKKHGIDYSIDNYYEKNTDEFDAYQRYYIKQYDDTNSYNYVEEPVLDATDFKKYNGENSELPLYVKAYPNVRFYWPTNPELSLLHLVFDHIPEWKIGHVDKQLWYQERTFSEDRTAVYDFLYNTAADTLDFVMVWDSINGVVHFFKAEEDGVTVNTYVQTNMYKENVVYYIDDKGTKPEEQPTKEQVESGQYYINIGTDVETQWDTDVFISKENLAESISISYSTDDIKTKLKITGSDNLDVRDVNLGQNYILNLDFYHKIDWMGPDLWDRYHTYKNALVGYTAEYKKLVSAWSAAYNEYSDLMNNVPVEPSVLMIGDYFDKLHCVYSPTVATQYNKDKTYYNEQGSEIKPTEDEFKNGIYYLSNVENQIPLLENKLNMYQVDKDDRGGWSTIAKTDDVLLTLENTNSDSATIRIRYNTTDKAYKIYTTITRVSSGLSNTTQQSLKDWVSGNLTADILGVKDFKVKSIGLLGAYLCLAKDESIEENLEDYGIRLLQEKVATYTKIFITQTEGYMSEEGSRCVASDTEPEGASEGDRWLNTSTSSLTVKQYIDGQWKKYDLEKNQVDFQNYARFDENYKKLQAVQAVLTKKQRIADYLLNGVSIDALHITDEILTDSNGVVDGAKLLYSLLRAAILHFVTPDNNLYISREEPSEGLELGDVWIRTLTFTSEVIVNKYTMVDNKKQWVRYTEALKDIKNILLTGISTEEKYITFIPNSTYTQAEVYKENTDYYILDSIDNVDYYVKPEAQPTKDNFGDKDYYIMDGTEYVTYLNNGTPYVAYARSQGLCLAKMNAIKSKSDMSNPENFNEQELMRLSPFIREDEYSDSNFLLTGYESEEEQMSIKQELLDRGVEELAKISKPKLSFDMTMANILAIPAFAPLKNQFRLGNFVNVGLREPYTEKENVKKARLLEVNVNFEDRSDFSCVFGDLLSTKSLVDKHAELLEQAVTAGKTVASNSSKWQKSVDKTNSLDDAINNGLKDAALSVGSANGQSIIWDQYGIRGRKLRDGTTDEYLPQQFALINNKLVFTDDNWATSRAVVGEFEIDIPNEDYSATKKQKMYGLLADALVGGYIQGTEIVGGSLRIGGEKGTFVVHENGSVQILVGTGESESEVKLDSVDAINEAYRYTIELSYNTSTIFNTEDDETTITARVKEWGKDITETLMNNSAYNTKFSWKRSSSETQDKDDEWNNDPSHKDLTTNTITIKANDFVNNAQFFCEVNFNIIEDNTTD